MISKEAGQAMTVISGIEHHRDEGSDAAFWIAAMKHLVMELDDRGPHYNPAVKVIRDALYAQWKATDKDVTPAERYALAEQRAADAAEALARATATSQRLVTGAENELAAARAALTEFEVSPGVPKPEFAEEAGDGNGGD